MTKAALLPHPADPFMLRYWLKYFNNVWANEVDRLYIYIGSPIEKPVMNYMVDLCNANPKINLQWNDVTTDHGIAIDRMLSIVNEDLVMLVEDDGFIFKPGYVSRYFGMLESGQYDIVGSARGSCAFEILDAAKAKWGLDYQGYGDRGPNFWPCFFWTRKELLLQTDRNFCARHWKKGETIEGLGYTVEKEEGLVGDTFVNTSLQLRGKIPIERIHMVPQYHGSPLDLDDYDQGRNLWDGQAMWTHIGSLSSGTHGVLRDDDGRMLARRTVDTPIGNDKLPDYCNTEGERKEWERRVQWWMMFLDDFSQGPDLSTATPAVRDFAMEYSKAIYRVIKQYGLSLDNIRSRIRIYKKLGL